jgi:hypothetical protein
MLRYNLLFVHIISAMGAFAALGMEAFALTQLRRAPDGATARAALAALGPSQRIGGLSMLVLLLTGIPLATMYWRWQGSWIGLGLAGLVAIGATGGLMTGRRVSRLQKSLGEVGVRTSLIGSLAVLRTSFMIRAALLPAVVYLMTVKPGRVVSLGVFGTAVVVGLVVSRVRPRSETPQTTRATG